jgi:hypothetical protein
MKLFVFCIIFGQVRVFLTLKYSDSRGSSCALMDTSCDVM